MAEKILTVFINESDDFEPYVIVKQPDSCYNLNAVDDGKLRFLVKHNDKNQGKRTDT